MADVLQSDFEDLALRKLQIPEDVEYHLDKHNLIGVGVFTHVYHVDRGRVRKVPAPYSDDLDLAIKSLRREGEIYVYLGDHPRVVKCLAKGDLFVDLDFSDGHDVLGFENSSHQLPRDLDGDMPSTVQSDLFALGSTLYEIMAGRRPYEGIPDGTITERYTKRIFPDVTSILCGDVIISCWQGCFRNAEEVLELFSLDIR
ncbi:hypothetical protein M430DRAFT_27902 [Amorphotheca resinae ATCC 22711]|uniref:Protein kinase domain-containing protein n=1 Tax=Amorphotheca resinae ATCC 22711 TaxID=857342 RepID=A0A2T3B1L1_AMORE|nr:hypothetical protein M430DRAFT_27902 [Amorphotheca resinae ATCC 22711]PSS18445.1 hypothetical protein M430DRAFT_27902 [Amorphotheca resinae ATCC 22711]